MGYVELPVKDGHRTLVVKREMGIFVFLTVILLTITLGYRKYWDHREKKKAIKREKQNRGEV